MEQWIGLVAGALTTAAFVPQVMRAWRTGSTNDLSRGMLLLFFAGLSLWLVYGVLTRQLPVILANIVTLMLTAVLIGLKVRGPADPLSRRPGATHLRIFWRRTLTHFAISLGLLGVSLLIGIWGYAYYEHLSWRDAFLNAAMILGGMGPVKTDLSEPGKVFAGVYALYAGLVVIAVAGLLLGPGVHHLMHHVHWDDTPDGP